MNFFLLILRKIAFLLASGLGTGYFPKAPGTFGSLLGFLIFMIIPTSPLLCILLFFIGWLVSTVVLREIEDKDPSFVVIDEIWGVGISFLFSNHSLLSFLILFVLFRFFDIAKPFPVSWGDQYFHKFQHPSLNALGVMLDDGIAGILAGLTFVLLSMLIY